MEHTCDLQGALDEISDILVVLMRGNAVGQALERVLCEDGARELEAVAALHAVASGLYTESTHRLREVFNRMELRL